MPVQQWNDDTLVVTLTNDPILSEEMAEVNALLKGACCDVVRGGPRAVPSSRVHGALIRISSPELSRAGQRTQVHVSGVRHCSSAL